MSDSLRSHGLQHTRLPCPSLSPRICSDSCPLNWWCCQTISSCTTHFSFCLQSLWASGIFPVSQFFASGGQSIGASVSSWNSYDDSEMLFYFLNKPLQEWMLSIYWKISFWYWRKMLSTKSKHMSWTLSFHVDSEKNIP